MTTPIHKLIIIGSGPAGYSAAVYAGRALLNPTLFEGSFNYNLYPGGQLTTTSIIENYLGFDSIDGYELTENFKMHALKSGTTIVPKTVIKVDFNVRPFVITDEDNLEYKAESVIITTGATAKKMEFTNSAKYWHNGISACAVCDGALPMFRNKPIAVVGGGDSAFEEALFLSKYASKVYLIHRRDTFRASKIMIDRAKNNSKIEFVLNSIVTKADGEELLKSITVKDTVTDKETNLDVNGLFFGIGHTPNTEFLKNSGLNLDENGYIITTDTKTNIPGVFAAGDVQDHKYRQAITSAGSGCIAALEAERYLETI